MYSDLGDAYLKLGDFKNAVYYYELRLKTVNEGQDQAEERRICANLGSAYQSLGNFKKAILYHERALKIA